MDDIIANSTENSEPKGWRDVLLIHPAAELFPLMTPEELRELADDLLTNGLRERVNLFDDPELGVCVIDGRNRLDALALLGETDFDPHNEPVPHFYRFVGQDKCKPFDPVGYVISKNVRRRHLTPEQRRDVIAKLLALDPAKSNRQLAAQVGVSHVTVGAVRSELEATGHQLEMTVGRDGKARPVHRVALPKLSDFEPKAQLTPGELREAGAALRREGERATIDLDLDRLRPAWSAVEAASDDATLKAALESLISEAANLLGIRGGLQ